jgi:hypothetical protein
MHSILRATIAVNLAGRILKYGARRPHTSRSDEHVNEWASVHRLEIESQHPRRTNT